jgi:hypothetical protein
VRGFAAPVLLVPVLLAPVLVPREALGASDNLRLRAIVKRSKE